MHLRNCHFGNLKLLRQRGDTVDFLRMGTALQHVPVLQTTVLRTLSPKSGESVLDCTLGLGGHSSAFLEATGPSGTLVGLDADEANLAEARKRLDVFRDRIDLRHMNFRDASELEDETFDIIFADLGLSSPHVDDPSRGFSFRQDGPLDLRYDRSSGKTASELIESSSEDELTMLIHDFGEVHQYVRPLARKLAGKRIAATSDLRMAVEDVFAFRAPSVLPRIFQTLRIAVNDELSAIQSLLEAIPGLLNPRGRVGFLSYHSLEDRIVKHAFRSWSTPAKDPLTGMVTTQPEFVLLTKKALEADDAERSENPRSRSAKFRAIQKLPS